MVCLLVLFIYYTSTRASSGSRALSAQVCSEQRTGRKRNPGDHALLTARFFAAKSESFELTDIIPRVHGQVFEIRHDPHDHQQRPEQQVLPVSLEFPQREERHHCPLQLAVLPARASVPLRFSGVPSAASIGLSVTPPRHRNIPNLAEILARARARR